MIKKSHPRYKSLVTRHLVQEGVKKGITSLQGLIAQGRGEAFDYLLGEKTNEFAKKSIEAAAALLLLAKHPVISVNGNSAILSAKDIVYLARLTNADIEVNIFNSSKQREIKIKNYLIDNGVKKVLMPSYKCKIKHLESNRKYVNREGIYNADVVFVLLEDGDRTEALVKNGKKVIAVDINPLSRTSKKATITIIDNITRCIPMISIAVKKLRKKGKLDMVIKNYDNKKMLKSSLKYMLKNLS